MTIVSAAIVRVSDSQVVNRTLYDTDSDWTPGNGVYLVDDPGEVARIGDTYNGQDFVKPVIDPVPVYSDYATAHKALYDWASEFANSVTGDVPIDEKLSWDAKEQAAHATISATATQEQTDLLTAEASITGETLSDLSTAIIAKAGIFRSVVGRMAGLRRAMESSMKSADPEADPFVYDNVISAGKAQALAMAVALGLVAP